MQERPSSSGILHLWNYCCWKIVWELVIAHATRRLSIVKCRSTCALSASPDTPEETHKKWFDKKFKLWTPEFLSWIHWPWNTEFFNQKLKFLSWLTHFLSRGSGPAPVSLRNPDSERNLWCVYLSPRVYFRNVIFKNLEFLLDICKKSCMAPMELFEKIETSQVQLILLKCSKRKDWKQNVCNCICGGNTQVWISASRTQLHLYYLKTY